MNEIAKHKAAIEDADTQNKVSARICVRSLVIVAGAFLFKWMDACLEDAAPECAFCEVDHSEGECLCLPVLVLHMNS